MFKPLLVVFLLIVVGLQLSATSIASRGQVFEIARDELFIENVSESGRLESVERVQSAERLREMIRERNDGDSKASMVLYPEGKPRDLANRRILSSEILVRARAGVDLAALASRVGAEYLGTCSFDSSLHRIRTNDAASVDQARERLLGEFGVIEAELQLGRMHTKYSSPSDPYFSDQWHLAASSIGSIGVNASTVWDRYKGDGVRIGILDDGLQLTHPDLLPNLAVNLHYDFRDDDTDPSPALGVSNADDGASPLEDSHGTSVAGVAAARGFNNEGGSGVAPSAKVVGLRLIGGYTTDAQEAAAFSYESDQIHVKNSSWGPSDHGDVISGPGPLAFRAIKESVETGRNGKGTVFVFAAGNGLLEKDNSNKDGYATLPYAIAVSAVGESGEQAYYSEPGANVLVCAPASDLNQRGLISPDLLGSDGYNNSSRPGDLTDLDYTNSFGGTSGAAPIVSGVVALMLEANPNLGWRDVQEILIKTAQKNDATDADWQVNGSVEGFSFNHKYGAGLVDAEAAVAEAEVWSNLGPERSCALQTATVLPRTIPLSSELGITQSFAFSGTNLRVEHVQVTLSLEHERRGDLAIFITSPSGTTSRLLEESEDGESDIYDWTFMSTHFWGETASGAWLLRVVDTTTGQTAGRLLQATMTLRGTETLTPVLPIEPDNLIVSRQWANFAWLSWDDHSSNETGFLIERCSGFDSPWSAVATTSANVTSYYDYTVDYNTHYFYRVRAVNGNRSSGATLAVDSYSAWRSDVSLYSTSFEIEEGYRTGTSIHQQLDWEAYGVASAASASRIESNGFGSMDGAQLVLGNHLSADEGWHSASVYTPYIPSGEEIVEFSCKVAFRDNGEAYDNFVFDVYNSDGLVLFGLDFDMYYQTVGRVDENYDVYPTGKGFNFNQVYTLTITVDASDMTWSAKLDNVVLVNAQALSSEPTIANDLYSIDPSWYHFAESSGRNYMLVDDFNITVVGAVAPDSPEWQSLFEFGSDAVYFTWADSYFATSYEVQYRERGASSWTSLDMSEFTEFDYPYVIIADLVPETDYEVRVRASNAHGSSTYTAYDSVRTSSLFQDWLSAYDIPTDEDMLSDYDGDGNVLLIEYALGMNPDSIFNSPIELPLLGIDGSEGYLTLTYYKARDDISYTVQRSPNLSVGSWSELGVIQNYSVNGRTIQAAYPINSGVPCFLRLRVEKD